MEPVFALGLTKDLLPQIAIQLDLNSLNKLCKASKRFNEVICKSNIFWKQKLLNDFPNIDITNVNMENAKELYKYLKSKPRVIRLKLGKYFDIKYKNIFDSVHINQYDIRNKLVYKYALKKGDVLIFIEIDWRKFIWDGDQFTVDFGDDRFLFPLVLSFPEFPPYYWEDIIDMDYIPISSLVIQKPYIIGKFGERYNIIDETEFLHGDGYPVVKFIDYNVELA